RRPAFPGSAGRAGPGMGRARVPCLHPGALRRRSVAHRRSDRQRDRSPPDANGRDAMSSALSLTGPLGLELVLGALIVVVLLLGLFRPATPDRRAGWVSLIGLIG